MLELAKQYAKLKKTTILAHREEGKEITFVLASGPKLTMTESQLKLAIENMSKIDAVGTVADGVPSAPAEVARGATKAKPKKEG